MQDGGHSPNVGDLVMMALDNCVELGFKLSPLTEEDRLKGPDVLADELWHGVFRRIMEGKMQDKMLVALGDWIRLSHLSKIASSTADELNTLALACENVARAFLASAENLRGVAMEKQASELFQKSQRRSDGGVVMPVGYVKQDKKEIGFKGAVEVWKHPSGNEIRIRLTDGKKKERTKAKAKAKDDGDRLLRPKMKKMKKMKKEVEP